MQHKAYKILVLFLYLGTSSTLSAQVFGGELFFTYEKDNYAIQAYGIDNDSLQNNKEITLSSQTIRNHLYEKINFISFQNNKKNRKLKGKQFYETIVLKVISKKGNGQMLIFITGRFDDRLNYEFNIAFKEGTFSLFIPRSEAEQKALEDSYIAGGCKNITSLLREI